MTSIGPMRFMMHEGIRGYPAASRTCVTLMSVPARSAAHRVATRRGAGVRFAHPGTTGRAMSLPPG